MKKYFNVTGSCYPQKHYMVDLTERLKEIKTLVDRGEYFVINRARQYGKTTTLKALEQYLRSEYLVLSFSFQRMSTAKFQTESTFAAAFSEELVRLAEKKRIAEIGAPVIEMFQKARQEKGESFDLVALFNCLSELCTLVEKPVVLMVDEIDSASNNQIFLDFLAQLRDGYLEREEISAFHSVILAGIYDIRNLKLKLRPEEEHKYNSPWNARESNEPDRSWLPSGDCSRYQMVGCPFDIAAEFHVEMSFSIEDIAGMLKEYEEEQKIKLDIGEVAALLYDYTSGYPFLVSWLCKYIDEELPGKEGFPDKNTAWTRNGVLEAVKALVQTPNTLMDDMRKKITDYPKLREMLYAMLFGGQSFPFNPDHRMIEIGVMFGFVTCSHHFKKWGLLAQ